MDKIKLITQVALMGVAMLGASQHVNAAENASKYIKCYGVAASGKNDCGTSIAACGATIHTDNACYAWIFAPEGVCVKLANSSVGHPKENCKIPKAPNK